jgi:hypothetical protein
LEYSFLLNVAGNNQEVICFAFAEHYIRLYKGKDGKPIAMAVYSDSLYTNVRYYGAAPADPISAFLIFGHIVTIPKVAGLPQDAGRLF